MKRILAIAIAALLLLAAFAAGRAAGIRHAILDARITVEDRMIVLDLDGNAWEYYNDCKED